MLVKYDSIWPEWMEYPGRWMEFRLIFSMTGIAPPGFCSQKAGEGIDQQHVVDSPAGRSLF